MIGEKLGHYRVVGKLGAGGMGEVYRARDERLNRDVAVKILRGDPLGDAGAEKKLLREAQSASALNDPHICTIYEVGEANGQAFIVMELVEGRPLSSLIPPEGLPAALAVRYAAQIAAALAHAHDHGITHRDVKTSNVVITPSGQVKVLDFGLAKRMTGREIEATRSVESAAKAATIVGTVAYMAPEVLRGEEADARSDIWSFGIVLYEMSSGHRPFRGQTAYELSSAILREAPAPLPPNIPAGLRIVIERCLEKEPGHRYQRAGEAQAALEAVTSDAGTSSMQPAGSTRAAVAASATLRRFFWTAGSLTAVVMAVLVASNVGGIRSLLFPAKPSGRIQSLAVLPLDNNSGDANQQYFADGMTEELTTELSQISVLRVVSRTSAMRYRGSHKSVPEIAKELGVDAIVEGSVERAGDRVRITAQLIQGTTDTHLWAKSYDRDLRDVLRLQNEVAGAIVNEIQLKLTSQDQAWLARHDVVDPEAHENYLRGLFYLNKRTGPEVRKAIDYFQEAIQKDPNYAVAYLALANSYGALAFVSNTAPAQVFPQSEAAARRAIELDDQLAEAHTSLATTLTDYDWDWARAESEYQTALRLNPNSSMAHAGYAHFLRQRGDPEHSIREAQRALELDPALWAANFFIGQGLYDGRHYAEAAASLRKTLELEGHFWAARLYLGKTLIQQNRYAEALQELEKAGDTSIEMSATIGYAYARMGRTADARKVLSDLEQRSKRGYVAPCHIAKIYIALGEKEQAFAWLEKGYQQRDTWLTFIKTEPMYDPIRSDPRFQDLVHRIGFPQ